ncbi:MAG: ribonuclease III domain-containing protein [Clostridia bacterium]|nr:ribonuclease III domain-containing protein [Clostridia bacterium]
MNNEVFKESLIGRISAALGLDVKEPRLLNPLVLAYIGDTVYDLYVRTNLVLTRDATAHGLHLMASKRVCAKAQAEALQRILPTLSEDEQYIFRRGRNSHMGTVPKHAQMSDYRAATGLEALLGYLYLKGEDERLDRLMGEMLSIQSEE